MLHVALSPGNLSPRGFHPRVPNPHRVGMVEAGTVWGPSDVDPLRDAAFVRLGAPTPTVAALLPPHADLLPSSGRPGPGGNLTDSQLFAGTALGLALAAVPVAGDSLSPGARAMLDPELVRLMDEVTPAGAADAQRRERLALALRRRAWALAGYPRTQEPIAVLLPPDPPAQLLADLDAQTWTQQIRLDPGSAESTAVAAALDQGAVFCCRPQPGLRYAPEHLADLVHALRHSGAPVAHSPARFWPWLETSWLEDDDVVERTAAGGLPGGSLWYAADGPQPASSEGYAVHGLNAVPLRNRTQGQAPAAAWRLHPRSPQLLAWATEPADVRAVPTYATPPSYLVTAI